MRPHFLMLAGEGDAEVNLLTVSHELLHLVGDTGHEESEPVLPWEKRNLMYPATSDDRNVEGSRRGHQLKVQTAISMKSIRLILAACCLTHTIFGQDTETEELAEIVRATEAGEIFGEILNFDTSEDEVQYLVDDYKARGSRRGSRRGQPFLFRGSRRGQPFLFD